MEDATPTFARDRSSKLNFSQECVKVKENNLKVEKHIKKRHSHSKLKSEHHHEHHHDHHHHDHHNHHHNHKKRHYSEQFNLKKLAVIAEPITNKIISKSNKIVNNYYDFMKKNKFILRNDFDKKNVEKFLSSKEKAFEKPFLFPIENNDIILSSNFSLQ